jgi:cytochrome c-type biogenesis protein CcmH/NrfG
MKAAPALCVAAAVLLGAAGYGWTGHPGVASAPAPRAAPDPRITPEAEQASKALLANFGDVRSWLTLTDALIREGHTETAVWLLNQAIDRIPGNVDLWSQLGVALVAHAENEVTPAARLAFDRANRINPDHPAPYYYLGLAWLQGGRPDQALLVWQQLEARSAPDAPWRPMLERLIGAARTMVAMQAQQGEPPGATVPPR